MMWHDETLNGNSSRRVANSPELKRRGQPSTVPEDVHNVTMFPSYRCIIRGIHINTHIWFATQNPVWNWSLKALKVKVRWTNSYTAESFKVSWVSNWPWQETKKASDLIRMKAAHKFYQWNLLNTNDHQDNIDQWHQNACTMAVAHTLNRTETVWESICPEISTAATSIYAVTLGSDGADSQLRLPRTRRWRSTRTSEVVTNYIAWGRRFLNGYFSQVTHFS